MEQLPDLAALKAQLPAHIDPALVEGNIGLQWGMNEFRYGPNRAVMVKRLSTVTVQDVQRVASNYLSSATCFAISLRSEGEAEH